MQINKQKILLSRLETKSGQITRSKEFIRLGGGGGGGGMNFL